MDGQNFLSWNIPNLITVWLMVAVLGVIIMGVKRARGEQAS